MAEFSGQVILVGGSSGGVGRKVAAALLERGATVALHYRSRDTHIKELTSVAGPERIMAVQADLADRASARRMVTGVVERFGRVDGYLSTVGSRLELEPSPRSPTTPSTTPSGSSWSA